MGTMAGELRTTEVDGVPVYWVPGQRRMRGSLWFRVGLADESLPRHGGLHLLEHLALHGRDSIRVPVNGSVSMLHTTFDVEGEPDDVAEFLQQICRWLRAPDFSNLEHERRVLRAESATRQLGPVALHLLWRYGAQGPGLAAYDEFGLHTADPDRLRSLAADAFARGNAVLALTGPPPAGLRLPLADGERWPAKPAKPCDQPLPAGFVGTSGSVALSGVMLRSHAGPSLMRALQRGLERGFRHGAGVGYSGWSSYELVDAENAMVTAGIDILPEAGRRWSPRPCECSAGCGTEVPTRPTCATTWTRRFAGSRRSRPRTGCRMSPPATSCSDARCRTVTSWPPRPTPLRSMTSLRRRERCGAACSCRSILMPAPIRS